MVKLGRSLLFQLMGMFATRVSCKTTGKIYKASAISKQHHDLSIRGSKQNLKYEEKADF